MNTADLLPQTISDLIRPETIKTLFIFSISLIVMLVALKVLTIIAKKISGRYFSGQTSSLIVRGIKYAGIIVIVMTFFHQIGIDISAILGAAGIAGVAIGFAAQTSISNIISGLFLVSEKAIAVDDVIQIEGFIGTVLSIDLLSVKIRTLDNQYVRIPNEKLIKSEFTNITRYPIRRMTIDIGVSYDADVAAVRDILLDVAKKNPHCLDNPAPLFIFNKFGNSAQEITFGVWFEKNEFLDLKNSIMLDIKKRFDEEGIEIPFTQISLVQQKPEKFENTSVQKKRGTKRLSKIS